MKKLLVLTITFIMIFTVCMPASAVGNEEPTMVEYYVYFIKDLLHSIVGSVYGSLGLECSLCNTIHREAPKADGENNCTLIVNGKEITESTYVRINYDDRNAELPVLAIFRELGADIKTVGKIVIIKYNGEYRWLDTTQKNFGLLIPPGTVGGVRMLTEDDLIIEKDSFRYYFSKSFGGIEIKVDYENGIIKVDNM